MTITRNASAALLEAGRGARLRKREKRASIAESTSPGMKNSKAALASFSPAEALSYSADETAQKVGSFGLQAKEKCAVRSEQNTAAASSKRPRRRKGVEGAIGADTSVWKATPTVRKALTARNVEKPRRRANETMAGKRRRTEPPDGIVSTNQLPGSGSVDISEVDTEKFTDCASSLPVLRANASTKNDCRTFRKRRRKRIVLPRKRNRNNPVKCCTEENLLRKTQRSKTEAKGKVEGEAHMLSRGVGKSRSQSRKRIEARDNQSTKNAGQCLQKEKRKTTRSSKRCPRAKKEAIKDAHFETPASSQGMAKTVGQDRRKSARSEAFCAGDSDRHCYDQTAAYQDIKGGGSEESWTMEQDAALQNAYFLVRPNQRFWREVAKKVPGKTAKECFDRFYSAHPTPSVPQPRGRRHFSGSPIKHLSSDVFLSPTTSTMNATHRISRGKQGLLEAHRTVRHILRRRQTMDDGYEADLFAGVEAVDPALLIAAMSPMRLMSPFPVRGECLHAGDMVTPSQSMRPFTCGSGKTTQFLRPKTSEKAKQHLLPNQIQLETKADLQGPLFSPEVLKKESNPGRLDRYLDMLHSRRLERQRSSSRKKKFHQASTPGKGLTQDVLTAKAAVIAGAREMLRTVLTGQFQGREETSMISDEDEDDISSSHELV